MLIFQTYYGFIDMTGTEIVAYIYTKATNFEKEKNHFFLIEIINLTKE